MKTLDRCIQSQAYVWILKTLDAYNFKITHDELWKEYPHKMSMTKAELCALADAVLKEELDAKRIFVLKSRYRRIAGYPHSNKQFRILAAINQQLKQLTT